MTIIGYSFSEELNNTVAFGNSRSVSRCPGCLNINNKWDTSLAGVRIKVRSYDLSVTLDGITVASNEFRLFASECSMEGVVFRRLPDDPEFFQVIAARMVTFDAVRRRTRFEDSCPICRRHYAVAGATPAFLVAGESIGECELVRTDIEFGTGDEQGPILMCGLRVGNLLSRSELTGFRLKDVQG